LAETKSIVAPWCPRTLHNSLSIDEMDRDFL
jgi:hypothetical protein